MLVADGYFAVIKRTTRSCPTMTLVIAGRDRHETDLLTHVQGSFFSILAVHLSVMDHMGRQPWHQGSTISELVYVENHRVLRTYWIWNRTYLLHRVESQNSEWTALTGWWWFWGSLHPRRGTDSDPGQVVPQCESFHHWSSPHYKEKVT